jgi:hypothetical protein
VAYGSVARQSAPAVARQSALVARQFAPAGVAYGAATADIDVIRNVLDNGQIHKKESTK